MADYIEAPTMGEILREEYMIPMGITAARIVLVYRSSIF